MDRDKYLEEAEVEYQRSLKTPLQAVLPTTLGGSPLDEEEEWMARAEAAYEGGPIPEIDEETRAAAYVGQEDVSGEPMGAWDRFKTGLLGDTPEERQEVLRRTDPEAQYIRVPDTDVDLYRKNPYEDYRRVDAPQIPRAIEEGVTKETFVDTGRDIAGLAGEAGPEIIGEVGGMMLFRGSGGGGLIRSGLESLSRVRGVGPLVDAGGAVTKTTGGRFAKDMVRGALGAYAGERAQQAGQSAAGTQLDTPDMIRDRANQEGFYSIIGNTVGAGVGKLWNMGVKGEPLFRVTPEGEAAVQAAKELGIDEPLPLQLIDHPVIRILGAQSRALGTRINTALRIQQETVRSFLKGLSDPAERAQIIPRAMRAFDENLQALKDLTINTAKGSSKHWRNAGMALNEIWDKSWRTTGEVVTAMYETVKQMEQPSFDLNERLPFGGGRQSFLEYLDDLKRGIVGAGEEIPIYADPSGSGLVDPMGRALGAEDAVQIGSEIPEVPLTEFDGILLREIRKLRALDPEIVPREGFSDPLDVLRQVRANLHDVAFPGIGERATQDHRRATQLIAAIDTVIDNAKLTNPDAIALYREANEAAHKRFKVREQAAIIELAKTQRLGDYAESLAQPGRYEDLIMISRAVGKEGLDEIRDAFTHQLAQDPFNMSTRLAQFDKKTLNILLPKDRRDVIELAARELDQLKNTDLTRVHANQVKADKFAEDLFNTPKTRVISDLEKLVMASGGKEGPLGRSVRASIIDLIWKKGHSTVHSTRGVSPGFEKVDTIQLDRVMQDFEDRGLLEFLLPGEVKKLRNVQTYQRVADVVTGDTAVAMQANTAVANLRTLEASAVSTFIENFSVGRLMVGDRFRHLLVGRGAQRVEHADTAMFKLIGMIAASLSTEASTEQPLPDEFDDLAARVSGGTP